MLVVVSCRNEWSGIKLNVFASLSLKESLKIDNSPAVKKKKNINRKRMRCLTKKRERNQFINLIRSDR